MKVGQIRDPKARIKRILKRLIQSNTNEDEWVLMGLVSKYGQDYIAELLKEVSSEMSD